MKEIGLVGTGYWGPNVARSFTETGRARIRWLCDRDPLRLVHLSRHYPQARVTTRLEEMLADPQLDAVAISTPADTHYALTRQALEADKHVLVEKPITTDSRHAEELTALAAARGRVLMVGHVFEYNNTILAMKEILDQGLLGQVYCIDLERTNLGPVRTDVNVLWDLASHDISIICFLMNGPPEGVTAVGRSYINPGVEDVVFATFTYPHGVVAHVHASWLNPRKVRQITVVGSQQMALMDDIDLRAPLKIFNKRVDYPPPDRITGGFLEHKTMIYDTGHVVYPLVANQPLKSECDHFIDCLESGQTPRSDGASGLRVVRILEAAEQSMRQDNRFVALGDGR